MNVDQLPRSETMSHISHHDKKPVNTKIILIAFSAGGTDSYQQILDQGHAEHLEVLQ